MWKSTLHISQSLRTKQMDDVLKADPVYDHFSTNKYLKHYKQTLVDTGSVDHIVPFKHSQNYKGMQMNQLRPVVDQKMYPSTAGEELGRHFRKTKARASSNSASKSPSNREDSAIGVIGIHKQDIIGGSKNNKKKASQSPEKESRSPIKQNHSNIKPYFNDKNGNSAIIEESGPSRSNIGSATKRTRRKRGQSGYKTDQERIDKLVDLYFE